jgi:hypothetical protein
MEWTRPGKGQATRHRHLHSDLALGLHYTASHEKLTRISGLVTQLPETQPTAKVSVVLISRVASVEQGVQVATVTTRSTRAALAQKSPSRLRHLTPRSLAT